VFDSEGPIRDASSFGLRILASRLDEAGERLSSCARTARFLRGRLEFRLRPDDVFICSYPRSGTTWLQQLLVVLAHDGDPEPEHISDVSPWFERSLAVGARTATDFERLPAPRIFKSHLPYHWLPRGARCVYAVRDGRDVAVSYFNLYRSHLGFSGSFDDFLEMFLRGELQYGSWFQHVAAWKSVSGCENVHLVRYEDLKRDLLAAMAELADFCGLRRDPSRLVELAEQCSFSYMKAREHRFDHATQERMLRGMVTGRFVRAGQSEAFREYFDEKQLLKFQSAACGKRRSRAFSLRLEPFLH
jgi:hypothetical protein